MQRSKSQIQRPLTINFTSTVLKDDSKRKDQVMAAVCALLNSNGGELIIAFPNQTCETNNLAHVSRAIEQWIDNLIGKVVSLKKVKFQVPLLPHQISINIKGADELITVNYNMALPGHTQVNRISTYEPLEEIKHILFGGEMMTVNNELPTVEQVFVQGEEIKLTETYRVQFKQLKDNPAKRTTLADRIIGKSNRFLEYLSAFANFHGGTIYVGIDDEQNLINGEIISDHERKSIITKLTNKIEKLIWVGLEDGPQKGKNWDIHFCPVVDKYGKHIKSTFVIVIVVARCPGGVFLEEPESYHIVNGGVEKMKFSTWKERFHSRRSCDETENMQSSKQKFESTMVRESTRAELTRAESTRAESMRAESMRAASTMPESTRGESTRAESSKAESRIATPALCHLHLGRTEWSSPGNRKKSAEINGILIRMINDGSWKIFWARVDKEQTRHFQDEIGLVILLMKITAYYKQGDFDEAYSRMKEYSEGLSKLTKDRNISESREFLLKSSLERSMGNIKESYEEAKNGLAIVEQIPAGIVACNYYTNIGTVITILLEQEHDMENEKVLKKEAILFFRMALEHVDIANDYLPSKFDNKQKVHINLAFLHLECSFANDARDSKVEEAAIKKATNNLNAVDKCIHEGYALSDFRDCQFLLARSVLFYRRAQNLHASERERRLQLLKNALKFSTEAKEKATKCNFFEMMQCTSRHMDFFQRISDCNIVECEGDA